MVDREKAIGHLQIMHTWADFALEKGVELFDAKHLESIVEWTEEALELLKELEPHLVTEEDFDIVDNLDCIPAWCEEKTTGWMYWVSMPRAALDLSQYRPNNSCRYWTSRPTDEQRKAAKWND